MKSEENSAPLFSYAASGYSIRRGLDMIAPLIAYHLSGNPVVMNKLIFKDPIFPLLMRRSFP